MGSGVQRVRVQRFQEMKARGEFIAMVTAYDYNQAMLVDDAGVAGILVGDSLGNVVLGYESTVAVSMDEMVSAIGAVSRGANRAFVIGDMPFGSYQSDVGTAISNGVRLMKEGGAHSVKLEGGVAVEGTIRGLVDAGIPVMGHVGFTPQSIHSLGGYRVQGQGSDADRVIADAEAVERAGAFSVVLELVPSELSKEITGRLSIPTIGIGAGPHCDGQIQVLHDMLGLDPSFRPSHAGRYGDFGSDMTDAVRRYIVDVSEGKFPGVEVGTEELPRAEVGTEELPRAEVGTEELPRAEVGAEELPKAEVGTEEELPGVEVGTEEELFTCKHCGRSDLPESAMKGGSKSMCKKCNAKSTREYRARKHAEAKANEEMS